MRPRSTAGLAYGWDFMRLGLTIAVTAALLATVVLGGCGVRGPLETPGVKAASKSSKTPTPPGEEPPRPPHKDFPLDGLIR